MLISMDCWHQWFHRCRLISIPLMPSLWQGRVHLSTSCCHTPECYAPFIALLLNTPLPMKEFTVTEKIKSDSDSYVLNTLLVIQTHVSRNSSCLQQKEVSFRWCLSLNQYDAIKWTSVNFSFIVSALTPDICSQINSWVCAIWLFVCSSFFMSGGCKLTLQTLLDLGKWWWIL